MERKFSSLDQRAQQAEYKKTHQSKSSQSKANLERYTYVHVPMVDAVCLCVCVCLCDNSINVHFRDMQLLTMEEANIYEKKEKEQKTLRDLQNTVCIYSDMYIHWFAINA